MKSEMTVNIKKIADLETSVFKKSWQTVRNLVSTAALSRSLRQQIDLDYFERLESKKTIQSVRR